MQYRKFHVLIPVLLLCFAATSSVKAGGLLASDFQPPVQEEQAAVKPPAKASNPEPFLPFLQNFALEPQQSAPEKPFPSVETQETDAPPLAVRELIAPPQLFRTIDLTAPTDDLWQRLRNGFSMPGLNNENVLQQQQWYLSHPDYLRRVVERSRPYIHHIVEELEKRGMPNELALLPIVESAFNPTANSPAKASGLWQFIPSTGKRFDLKQNWWHDQRRDIVASTEAALEYLQSVYEMHGDWHLALASYNWGEGSVKRAIQKNAAKGLPTDYSSLTMPEETRQYVPKLIALKNIFSSAATLSELRIPIIPNKPYFATIEPGKPIDVRLAARLADMPVDEFVRLNPAHNRPVISGESTLVVPADKINTFRSNLDKHDAPLSSWQLYTTRTTERLDKLAPRFGISLADLKRVNGIKGGIRISAGTSLLVPARGGDCLRNTPNQIRPPQAVAERTQQKHGKHGRKSIRPGHSKPVATKAGRPIKQIKPVKAGKRIASASVRKPVPAKKTSRPKTGKRR